MTTPPVLAALAGRLEAARAKYGVPGAALAVRHGDRVYEAAAGVLDARGDAPARAESLFSTGCIMKSLVATLALQLVDEGKVELDAPIVRVLPELRLADAEATARITLRHLLSHSAGFDANVQRASGEGDDCFERFVAQCADLPQLFEPGARFAYGPTSYIVVARAIEALCGLRFREALASRLLEPLGIDAPFADPDPRALRAGRAATHYPEQPRGHAPRAGDAPPDATPAWVARDVGYRLPRAYEATTDRRGLSARDLVRFAGLFLDGGRAPDGRRILSEDAVREMQAFQVDVPNSYVPSWGLGFAVWGHESFGHNGFDIGQSAHLRIVPRRGLAVALLANVHEDWSLHHAVFQDVLAEAGGANACIYRPKTRPLGRLVKYMGVYEGACMSMVVELRGGRLELSTRLADAQAAPDIEALRDVDLQYRVPATFELRPAGLDAFTTDPGDLAIDFFDAPDGRPGWLRYTNKLLRRVD